MRIIFAGTGNFALLSLEYLIKYCQQQSKCQLAAVYTQPDRESGRNRAVRVGLVKQYADNHGIPVYQPRSLKKITTQNSIKELQPDLMVVVSYGLLLPSVLLSIPRLGCINVHASLLPRWRGAAPIQRALLEGDQKTGITIMQMDAGLDTGAIISQTEEPILASDTSESLFIRLALRGASDLITVVKKLSLQEEVINTPQLDIDSCYASKMTKQEGAIDWARPATEIERAIRAFQPWPVSFSWINGTKLRVWGASLVPDTVLSLTGKPGTIIQITSTGVVVATGQGYLELNEVQREGGRRLPILSLLNGSLSAVKVGVRFDNTI